MKEIKAYIRRDRLDAVVNALAQIKGLSGVSVNTINGFGRSRGILKMVDFEKHIKVETVCSDEIKEQVVKTILDTARTERRGDGKIFVDTIEEAWRIETAENISNAP